MASSDDLWGTAVSDVQTDVTIENDAISGTLKYIDSGALANSWGAGNFLALDLSSNDFSDLTSVKVGMEPSVGSGLVELIDDPDKNGVFKVSDKYNQKFVIVSTDGKNTVVQKYALSGLTLENA